MTIISHKYKFIFLKTFKTAGSSIELSLSKYCGKDDIITSLGPEEDQLRKEQTGVVPQNYSHPIPLKDYNIKDYLRLVYKARKPSEKAIFYRHMPAAEVKAKIGDEIWNSYFKFCVVRNPWDRAVSNYFFQKGKGDVKDLEDYFKKGRGINNNVWIYAINQEIAVEQVCRYETLLNDLNDVCRKLEIPFDGKLAQLKTNYRTDKKHYSQILNEAQVNHIRERCHQEIEWFGYKFESLESSIR